MLGDTPKNEEVEEDIYYILGFNLPGYQYDQTLPGIFVDDVQYLESPAVNCTVYHEIITPYMVFIFWSQPDAGAIIEP